MDEAKIQIGIDNEADILLILKGDTYPAQICEEVADEIVVRLNPITKEVEAIQIMNFSERFFKNDLFELPVIADFFLAKDLIFQDTPFLS
jgi:hypothetical protein